MTTTVSMLAELQQKLQSRKTVHPPKRVFIGFDGFVDFIKKAVRQKRRTNTIYFKTLTEFSERIRSATGRSGQIELVTQKVKLGGNAPILANALGYLGVSNFCIGSLGLPDKHPVFSEMNKLCQTISVLKPGYSDAIEFDDGKIIFSELSVFNAYDWKHIKETIGLDNVRKIILENQILAFVDWVNLPHASDIWEGVLHDVIKPSGRKDFFFLFDLCDPSKKTIEEIDEVLDLISCFSPYGKVTMGLNENETLKIWSVINGVDIASSKSTHKILPVKEAGEYVYKAMNIDSLLVHPIDRTILYHHQDVIELEGHLVLQPKVLTGGGDNLNAGYCLGLIYGLSTPDCMLLGMAASGAYIQNGKSPDFNDIIDYLNVWMEELNVDAKDSNGVPILT